MRFEISSLSHIAFHANRSKHETKRLHKLSKPTRRKEDDDDDLPSINSHSDDNELWDSDLGDDDSGSENDLDLGDSVSEVDSDAEQECERLPRPKDNITKKDELKGSERLPVKLADGTIRKRGNLPAPEQAPSSDEDEDDSMPTANGSAPRNHYGEHANSQVEDVSTGARFGRPAVATVLGTKSKKARIQAAKEQLAAICQEIVADPENSVCSSMSPHYIAYKFTSIFSAWTSKTAPLVCPPLHNTPFLSRSLSLSRSFPRSSLSFSARPSEARTPPSSLFRRK